MRLRACLVLILLLATGCGLRNDPPEGVRPVVGLLTRGLADHTLDRLPLVEAASAKLFADQVAALGSYDVDVKAGDVSVHDDKATVALTWTWRLGDHDWTYSTTADLLARDGRWRVLWRPDSLAPDLSSTERLHVSRQQPRRGDIVGATGEPIVTARDVVRYGLDKSRVRAAQVARSARRIAKAVGVRPAAYVRAAQAGGPKAFIEATVVRAGDAVRTVDARAFSRIPGALAVNDSIPLGPTSDFAAEILGRVGPATAELVAASHGRIVAGDQVGLSGLEARYDDQLGGIPTTEVRAVKAASCAARPACGEPTSTRVLAHWAGRAGKPLALTLDIDLQAKAERILDRAGDERSPASAIVAIRPSTGEILAAANGPGNKGLNAATYGHYAPGSTFKIVSSLALLRAGITPDQIVSCPPTIGVDGRWFKNYDDYPAAKLGKVTFMTAIANSCNTAVIGQRGLLGAEDVADAAAALGLGVDHDLGFPAYFGQVPPPVGETEKAADLIGQGKVLASPMAMATVAASVAAGHVVVPHLLAEPGPMATPKKPLTDDEADQLRALMRAVVTAGSAGFLGDLPGAVGAKTGTAEYGKPDSHGALPTHAWMIATQGDLAVAVFVETGASGSASAGPLLEAFLR